MTDNMDLERRIAAIEHGKTSRRGFLVLTGLAVGAALYAAACGNGNQDTQPTPNNTPAAECTSDVVAKAGYINVKVREDVVENQGLQTYLYLESTEFLNYKYKFRTTGPPPYSGSTIDVDITGFEDTGTNEAGPASAKIPLNLKNGQYTLVLKSGPTCVDRYSLRVEDAFIELKPTHKASFTNPGAPKESIYRFYRAPPNTFAVFCGTPKGYEKICDEFVNALTGKLSLKEFTFPNDGEIPFREEGTEQYMMRPKFYTYPSSEAWKEVCAIAEEFVKHTVQGADGYKFQLSNEKGESFKSWLLD